MLVHEPSRSVLVGDALFNRGSGLEIGPAAMAADPSTRVGSLTRIPHDVRAVGFAHGAPLTGAGVEGFHQFVRRLSPGA